MRLQRCTACRRSRLQTLLRRTHVDHLEELPLHTLDRRVDILNISFMSVLRGRLAQEHMRVRIIFDVALNHLLTGNASAS